MADGEWTILPHFLLRSTGFPVDLLDRLAFHETAAALETLLTCEDEVATLGESVLSALRAGDELATLKLRRRYWDRVHRRRPAVPDDEARLALGPELCHLLDRWDEALARHAALEEAARATFSRELPERRRQLRDIVTDERFQEAVWLSSPQMLQHGLHRYLDGWSADHRPSHARHVERQLISYLQRFCAKNDTTSFFGPLNYGDFAAPAGAALPGPGAQHVQRREVFMAYWGVAALMDALVADRQVQPYLRPRRSPLARVDLTEGRAALPGGLTMPLAAQTAALLRLVDGTRTVAELARALGLTVECAFEELERLAQAHVIAVRPEIPVTEVRPLERLVSWVHHLPDDCPARVHWCETLDELKRLQDCFATAPLDERRAILDRVEQVVTALTSQEARRSGGQLYADRLLLYEECLGGMSPLSLGAAFAAELHRQLAPVLDLFAAHACAVHQQLQAYGAGILSDLAPRGRMPFLSCMQQLRQRGDAFEPSQSPEQQAVLAQLDAHAPDHQVELDVSALPPVDRAVLARAALVTSPDIMLLARDDEALRAGDFRVVLAECHDTLMIWGWPLSFHARRPVVEAAARDLLRGVSGGRHLANVLASKRVKIVPFEYPGPTIEMLATSEKAPEERIPAAEVCTAVEDGRPVLHAPGWPRLALYNGELPTLAHAMFALPRVVAPGLSLGAHTPRILLGKAVVQREQWRVPREALLPGSYQGASFELLRDYWRAARRLDLPRYLFARTPGERKPVLVDRYNYFLLELLEYLLPKGAEVTLSEMLPAPDELWLRGENGSFCAELRLSAGYVTTAEPAS